ncbi:MAG: hypothetical protein QM754_18310 [Tepidisphaeraceae bacterium]
MKHDHPEIFNRLSLDEVVLMIGIPGGLAAMLDSSLPAERIRAGFAAIDRERVGKRVTRDEQREVKGQAAA